MAKGQAYSQESYGKAQAAISQHSVARLWNEVLLDAIRKDYARPTVHARNLFHTAIAMYDAWAAFDDEADTVLLGKTLGNYHCDYREPSMLMMSDIEATRNEAVSYAAYRLLSHRFAHSPGASISLASFDALFSNLGYNPDIRNTNYMGVSGAVLGNLIAKCVIEFGLQDGANEVNNYENQFYQPTNVALVPAMAGNRFIVNLNRWQPLSFETFIDQSGNTVPGGNPPFVSPEWGMVTPFALKSEDLKVYERDGHSYWVYHDPGPPALIDSANRAETQEYLWNFALVAVWSSHLDPSDGVMIDISPAAFGNLSLEDLPKDHAELHKFYNFLEGGDISQGHKLNPYTGQPYQPQIVPRGDYTRVLAEFWADGLDSETPPGHWFTILNYVSDHPLFQKRFRGEGEVLNDLEWDVKAYVALGGAMHDAAISAWGIKGWYDYVRPISVIRALAANGQSSDPNLPYYSPFGIPLVDGIIELAPDQENLIGLINPKIRIKGWRGPQVILDPRQDTAGVGWVWAEDWWPYQRPTFVTPPFAGYVSGHSTFSRAAAEVMTLLTGSEYFPGGLGEFKAPKNEFLVFEEGPSVDITLQWATYRDASDQTSLSRIWGGIHPPVDDIPGRIIGAKVGVEAFLKAERYFY
ncbi:MAG: vanadium-dependent haloperoxidase [Deinococcales bacterium]